MNNTLLFIVIGIIVIAIIALLVLKKLQDKQGKLPRPPSIDKQPNVKVADPRVLDEKPISTPAQHASQAPIQAPVNELANIETYISHQDYTSAINELKRLLITNPRHTQAMLKLLQVYGLTGQMVAFNQLYQKICEIADDKTIQEAGFLKSILEPTPQVSPAPEPTPAPVAKPIEIDKIDFDVATPTKPTPIPTPTPVVEADDVLELDFNLDDKSAPKVTPQAVQDDVLIFDFETSAPSAPKTSVVEPTPVQNVETLSFDFEPSTPTTTKSNTVDKLDDLDFDFSVNDAKASTPTVQATADVPVAVDSTPAKTEDEFAGFDFDFGLDEPTKPAVTTQTSSTQQEAEIVFDLETLETTSSQATKDVVIKPEQTQTKTTPADKVDFEFDFDAPQSISELSFDAPKEADTLKVADGSLTAQPSEFSFDDFATKPAPAQKPVTPSQSSPKLEPSLDLADFDAQFGTDDTKAPTDDFASLSFDASAPKLDEVSLAGLDDDLTAKTTQKTSEPSFDLSDFELNINADKPTQDATTSPADALSVTNKVFDVDTSTTQVTDNLDELSFDLPASEPVAEQTLTAKSDVADEFSWDNLEISPTSNADEPSFTFDEPTPAPQAIEKQQDIPVVVPVVPTATITPKEPSISFDDDIQITLELAKQYVEFGEYDSAKRLLQEVTQEGSTTQKQEAHTLMVMIA